MKQWMRKIWPYLGFALISMLLLLKPIGDGDELWNFNFARNIIEERRPYRDFNMLQTPFSAYFSAFLMSILGCNLHTFRVVAVGLLFVMCVLVYINILQVHKKEMPAMVISMIIAALHFPVWNYNYNNLCLCLMLLIMWLENKQEKNSEKSADFKNAGIGVLYGLMPMIKQSTGGILCLINVVISIWGWKKQSYTVRLMVFRIVGSIMPTLLWGIYLVLRRDIKYFWEYAVLGVEKFTHYVGYFEFILDSPLKLLIGLTPIIIIYCTIRKLFDRNLDAGKAMLGRMLILSLGAASVAYPLCDYVHMVVLIVPFMILLPSVLGKYWCRDGEDTIFWGLPVCVFATILILQWPEGESVKLCTIPVYEGLFINEELENLIVQVDNYILEQGEAGQQIIVADEYGALYTIPLKQCYKNFDMLLVGNQGIADISTRLNYASARYLVRKDESTLGYQADLEMIHYIKQNYNKIGEVSIFEVYCTNETQTGR